MGKSLQSGKYILEQELGRGGFGVTYRATNSSLGQTVVIKTLNESLQQDAKFATSQQQFQEEARRLAKFSHPHIVRVTDFFIEDGLPYIVMDYVPGRTLDAIVLPNNPLPEAIALHYIRQVSAAVKVVHQNGLLHRDIKPQNLILQEGTQNVVLIDFGIAREFTPGLTQTHTHLVSEGYAPIEQYLPQARRSPATDIYGLAATLYTLLTAQVPVAATLRDRLPLPSPREVRPDLSALVSEGVMRGLAIEPHHRPATVDTWLALFPEIATQHIGEMLPIGAAAAKPNSQMATLAVAPAHYPTSEGGTLVPATPLEKSKVRLRMIGLIGAAVIAPFGLGYALLRSSNSTDKPTVQPSAVVSPSPSSPEATSEGIAQEPEPTEIPLSTDTPTTPPETSEEPATPDLVESMPSEPTTATEPEPPLPEPEANSETTETPRRAEEQAREDRKRGEERAQEAQRREAERARQRERREEERARERGRGRGEGRGNKKD